MPAYEIVPPPSRLAPKAMSDEIVPAAVHRGKAAIRELSPLRLRGFHSSNTTVHAQSDAEHRSKLCMSLRTLAADDVPQCEKQRVGEARRGRAFRRTEQQSSLERQRQQHMAQRQRALLLRVVRDYHLGSRGGGDKGAPDAREHEPNRLSQDHRVVQCLLDDGRNATR